MIQSDILGIQIRSRDPLNLYGSMETALQQIRKHRPLDLNAERWRKANPRGTFDQWREAVTRCLLDGFHYDPGALDLKPQVIERVERPSYTQELVAFNTTPWFRVEGCFLLPQGASADRPVPAILLFHEWGGPMFFGKERCVNTGRDHPLLQEHRALHYSGRYLAETFIEAGYAVLCADAYHFGRRAPRGLNGIPDEFDPMMMNIWDAMHLELKVCDQIYLGARQLQFAGTTWAGVNYWDDSRCVDYLISRPEVDANHIGCTGLSVGGWRTNMLAACDRRIKASVSVGWMTTGDHQQLYNLAGAIGVFAMLPGVWDRLDIPDLTVLAASNAAMVVSCSQDLLFPPEAQIEADRQARDGFAWARCPEQYQFYNPPKGHCYDADIQREAIAWFDRHLRSRK